MSAAAASEPRPLVLTPAWRHLAVVAAATRRDWDWEDTRTALLAAETAGWEFERAFREVCRLVLDPNGEPNDLRNTVRSERPRATEGHLDPAVKAAAWAKAAAATEATRAQGRGEPVPARQEAGTSNQEGHQQ